MGEQGKMLKLTGNGSFELELVIIEVFYVVF